MISLCTADVVFILTDTAVKIFSKVATYYTLRSHKNFFLRQRSKSLIEEAPRTIFITIWNLRPTAIIDIVIFVKSLVVLETTMEPHLSKLWDQE